MRNIAPLANDDVVGIGWAYDKMRVALVSTPRRLQLPEWAETLYAELPSWVQPLRKRQIVTDVIDDLAAYETAGIIVVRHAGGDADTDALLRVHNVLRKQATRIMRKENKARAWKRRIHSLPFNLALIVCNARNCTPPPKVQLYYNPKSWARLSVGIDGVRHDPVRYSTSGRVTFPTVPYPLEKWSVHAGPPSLFHHALEAIFRAWANVAPAARDQVQFMIDTRGDAACLRAPKRAKRPRSAPLHESGEEAADEPKEKKARVEHSVSVS